MAQRVEEESALSLLIRLKQRQPEENGQGIQIPILGRSVKSGFTDLVFGEDGHSRPVLLEILASALAAGYRVIWIECEGVFSLSPLLSRLQSKLGSEKEVTEALERFLLREVENLGELLRSLEEVRTEMRTVGGDLLLIQGISQVFFPDWSEEEERSLHRELLILGRSLPILASRPRHMPKSCGRREKAWNWKALKKEVFLFLHDPQDPHRIIISNPRTQSCSNVPVSDL